MDFLESSMDRRRFLSASAMALGALTEFGFAEPPLASADSVAVQRLSWAGVRIQTDRSTVFFDPWTNASIWGGVWKQEIVPVEVVTPARFVCLTHMHNDHFDPATLRKIFPEIRGAVLCAEEAVASVAALGVPVRAVKLNEAKALNEWLFTPVPAVDGLGDPQVSWIAEVRGLKFIHCGDTLWHGYLRHIGRQHGPFDVAFLPINGPRLPALQPSVSVPAVLTPEQAVEAGILLRAKLVVPIHYGLNSPGDYEEYPNAEKTFLEAADRRGVKVRIVKPGEEFRLSVG